VESFRIKVLQGTVDDADEWLNRINKFEEPEEQLEALRAWIVDVSWEEVIKNNITDGLEQYLHMENGKFNFKNPSAVIEAGRSKAYVRLTDAMPRVNRSVGLWLVPNRKDTAETVDSITLVNTMYLFFTAHIIAATEKRSTPFTPSALQLLQFLIL
jgi:hypothetical protein